MKYYAIKELTVPVKIPDLKKEMYKEWVALTSSASYRTALNDKIPMESETHMKAKAYVEVSKSILARLLEEKDLTLTTLMEDLKNTIIHRTRWAYCSTDPIANFYNMYLTSAMASFYDEGNKLLKGDNYV